MRTIETGIEIQADADTVWRVLTQDRDRAWDPMFASLEGELATGSKLALRMQGGGPKMKMSVTVCERGRVLEWTGGLKGLFFSRHRFEIIQKGAGTQLRHFDSFNGFLVSLLGAFFAGAFRKIVMQYEDFNAALKREAEKIAAT